MVWLFGFGIVSMMWYFRSAHEIQKRSYAIFLEKRNALDLRPRIGHNEIA